MVCPVSRDDPTALASTETSTMPSKMKLKAPIKPTRKTHTDEPQPSSSYPAVVGVHNTLLAFAALFLPQSKGHLELAGQFPGAVRFSSTDHPQRSFLVAITTNPTLTLLSLCASAALLQSWWAGWIRGWYAELSLQGTAEEVEMQKVDMRQRKASVCLYYVLAFFSRELLLR